jgi:aryl-alcohol dehydrogenase-like predicted oxidoreductase
MFERWTTRICPTILASMKKRTLGKGGFEIGEVGIGCWQFGGDFGPMEEATAFAILEAAVESGTDFFDTADVYGSGRSEELIGRFLKTCGKPITVATKVGREDDLYPNLYRRETMRNSLQRSAKRLAVEVLDLVQLHCIPTSVLRDGEVFDWLRDFQSEGLIRHFGVSVESVEEGLICLEQEGLLSLQVIFNPFRMKLADELLPQAQSRGVGIIVRLPLASGLLSGKFTKETAFPVSDHRNYNAEGEYFNVGETFAGLPFQKGVELADALKEFLPPGMTLAQMTLRWILDHEAVSVIIPGASSPAQALGNASASELESLPAELHERLRMFYQAEVAGHIRGPY